MDLKALAAKQSFNEKKVVDFGYLSGRLGARRIGHIVPGQSKLGKMGLDPKSATAEKPLFSLQLEYITRQQVEQISSNAAQRLLMDPVNITKGIEVDREDSMHGLLEACVRGWTMTVGALRALRCPIKSIASMPADEPVPFTADNLRVVGSLTILPDLVSACLDDYDLWFPEEAAQEGNSESGRVSSSGGSLAANAS